MEFKGSFWNLVTLRFLVVIIFFGIISVTSSILLPFGLPQLILIICTIVLIIPILSYKNKLEINETNIKFKTIFSKTITIKYTEIKNLEEGAFFSIGNNKKVNTMRPGMHSLYIDTNELKPLPIQKFPFSKNWETITKEISKNAKIKIKKI